MSICLAPKFVIHANAQKHDMTMASILQSFPGKLSLALCMIDAVPKCQM